MTGRDSPGSVLTASDSRSSWRFGASFCRPSAHCSHLSLADSSTLEVKLSPATRTSMMEPGKNYNQAGLVKQIVQARYSFYNEISLNKHENYVEFMLKMCQKQSKFGCESP
jgi:hypothetical protein